MLNPHRNFHTYFQHDLIYYVLVKIDKCLVVNYAIGSKFRLLNINVKQFSKASGPWNF